MKHWIHGLTCLLLLSQLPLQAVEIGSAEAMRLALQDEPTRDRDGLLDFATCPFLEGPKPIQALKDLGSTDSPLNPPRIRLH